MRHRPPSHANQRPGEPGFGPTQTTRMWRGFTGAVIVGIVSLLLVGVLWGISRSAPSAGRDPNMTPLVLVPTRTPEPNTTLPAPEDG